MKKLGALAAIGAALGSVLRYFVGQTFESNQFPIGTFSVNVAGSLLIGLFLGIPSVVKNDQRRVFLITGLLGGFTTFSAVMVESLQLSAQSALVYIFATVFSGTLATILGFKALGNKS